MTAHDSTGLIIIVVAACTYFLPTLIAMSRRKSNGTGGVFFLNLVLGWTLVGWFVAFIWACSGSTKTEDAREEQWRQEMLAATRERDAKLAATGKGRIG